MSFQHRHRINRHITLPQVRVIGSNGVQLGVMPTYEAQRLADEEGLDLVEIVPNQRPSVCQIMDYGKFKYESSLKEKQQRKKNRQIDMKEVQLRPVTGDHDLEVKIHTAERFLEEGRTVQVTVCFKKRELQFKDQGMAIIEKVVDALKEKGTPDSKPSFNGRNLIMRLRPTKSS